MRLAGRVRDLERANGGFRFIVVNEGQTEQDAVAAHKAKHGPYGNAQCVIISTGVKRSPSFA